MPERDSGGWKHKASALGGAAIAGAARANLPAIVCGAAILSEAILVVAIVGALLTPGPPPAPPAIAAAPGPINVQALSDETVATSRDAGATLLKESTQPAHLNRSEEQAIDLAQASGDVSAAEAFVPAAADAAQAPGGLSGETPRTAPFNTPVATAPIAAPPPAASEFPDAQTMRAVPLRPDGTQVATRPPSATASGETALASDIAKLPAELAPKAASETAGIAEASTSNLDSPAKLSGKSSARVMVAGINTIAPSAAMETPSQQVQPGAPVKSEKAAKIALKAPQAAVETQAARPAPSASTHEPVNPLARVVAELVGALAAPAGWAVQLAAPKSETEAESDLARLDAKYTSLLNGAAIAVQKAQVKGATVYRLRVVGLFKADAAALCARVKGEGGDCFIAKASASSPSKGGGRGFARRFDADPQETRPSLSSEWSRPQTDTSAN